MKNRACWLSGFLIFMLVFSGASSGLAGIGKEGQENIINGIAFPKNLTCEDANKPCIDTVTPRLSWMIEDPREGAVQTAYRILAASTPERLADNKGDLWDSGKIAGDCSVFIPYDGRPLKSRQVVFWKVRVWDKDGKAGSWSEPSMWRMGLLDAGEWRAQWIAAPDMSEPVSEWLEEFLQVACVREVGGKIMETKSLPLFRKRSPTILFRRAFRVEDGAEDAIVRICGLGVFHLFVNGKKVGDGVLEPISTDYDKIAYYNTFEISSLLREGENAIAVEVADGFYGQAVAFSGHLGYGPPKLLAEVEWADATGKEHFVGTEPGWKVHYGPTLRANSFAGEYYDARQEIPEWKLAGFNDSSWPDAVGTLPGSPRLASQVAPSVKVLCKVRPIAKSSPKAGTWTFDFGENFSGVARIRMHNTKPGQHVTVQFCEFLRPDGTLDQGVMRATGVRQTETYVCRGGDVEEWTPGFSYFGFRYAEVTGLTEEPGLDLLEGVFLSAAVEPAGVFECSLDLYNRMHRMAVQTMKSNIHGVFEDCPTREKCGWLGDYWMPLESWLMDWDLGAFNDKFLRDIRLVYRPDGVLSDIAGGKRRTRPPAVPMRDWMAASLIAPWLDYVYTGDLDGLRRHYPFMVRYAKAKALVPEIIARYESGEIKLKRSDRFFFGDWGDVTVDGKRPPGETDLFPAATPAMLSGTQAIIYGLRCAASAASVLGEHADDADKFTGMADELVRRANAVYFNTDIHSYGSQAANAWAWKLGMAPEGSQEKFRERMGQEIREKDHCIPTTGQLGLGAIYQSLTEAGHGELVYELANADVDHGFRCLIEKRGATTLWEHQGRMNFVPPGSGNHPAFSGYDSWFYEYLCGIRPDPSHPGFKHFRLAPWLDPRVDWAKASHKSPYGEICSAWKKQPDGTVDWNVTIPPNTTATLHCPVGMVFSSDGTASQKRSAGTYHIVMQQRVQ